MIQKFLAVICIAILISGCGESQFRDVALATSEQIQEISEHDVLFHPTVMPTYTASPKPTDVPTSLPTSTETTSLNMPSVLAIPLDLPAYDRSEWKHWIDEDGDCQNTRHEVLIEESSIPVEFKTSKECQVAKGEWWGAFTNTVVSSASKLDIDHLIPLKNAHVSGGWKWDRVKKAMFANSMSNAAHLIAVTASANRSKGAKSPDQWKPPNKGYWCRYATDWIKIKHDWSLNVTEAELQSLKLMLEMCQKPLITTESADVVPTTSLVKVVVPADPVSRPTPISTGSFELVALDCRGKPESVTVRNNGVQTTSIGGWMVHDEGKRNSFTFSTTTDLDAGETLTLWSGREADRESILWKRQGVWNNNGDTAYLLNLSGALVDKKGCD